MHKVYVVMLLALVAVSCDNNRVYDKYQTIAGGWAKEEPIKFIVEEIDSVQPFDVYITLRNTNDYKYSNLFLITRMDLPNGKQLTDTLEYAMAAPDGTWLGTGFNDVKESKLWYREGMRFRESGPYTISIQQAVRKNGNVVGDIRLEGITEVGLRIERPENE